MDGDQVQSQLLTVGQYRFEQKTNSISNEKNLEQIEASYAVADSKNLLLKMKLAGRLPPAAYDRLSQVEDAVAASVFDLRWDDSAVTRQVTNAEINETYTEGSFPHRLLRSLAQSDENFEALQKAHEIIEELRQ